MITPEKNKPNLCVLVIKVKKLSDNKCAFDHFKKFYVIKNKFLKDNAKGSNKKIEIGDIISLNMRDFLQFEKSRLENYYKSRVANVKK